MKESIKVMSVVFLVIICLTALGWFFSANDVAKHKVFAPIKEQIRHDTFKQSAAYNDGMAQELGNMHREYITATDEQKEMLKSLIQHRTDGYDTSKLPPDLRYFIEDMRK